MELKSIKTARDFDRECAIRVRKIAGHGWQFWIAESFLEMNIDPIYSQPGEVVVSLLYVNGICERWLCQ